MIALSGSLQTAINDPDNYYQWSQYEPDENYWISLAEENLPSNVAVVHTPPKMTESQIERFCSAVFSWDPSTPIVFHPNHAVLRVLSKYSKMGLKHWCIENFPWGNKKPLRTPLAVADFAIRNEFGVCYDFAHVDPEDEPAFKSVEFLRAFLPWVTVVHFSGNRHRPLTAEEWKIWRDVILLHPGCLATIQWFCLEHIDTSAKLRDKRTLEEIFEILASR